MIDDAEKMKQARISEVDLNRIEANPFQPRSDFNEESLEELAGSIKKIGLIQPVTLRKADDNKYQIIVGERRCRAARIAGFESIPAYVREAEDDGMLEMALVENIQREDLDSIEIALSYRRLLEECNLTQEELSNRVGKKRSTIANYLRLLKLPAVIQKALKDKKISMGHARALINIEDSRTQEMIYNKIIKNEYSVRKVEEIVRRLTEENDNKLSHPKRSRLPEQYKNIKIKLVNILGSRVGISINDNGRGKIMIPFKTEKELERIVKIIENNK